MKLSIGSVARPVPTRGGPVAPALVAAAGNVQVADQIVGDGAERYLHS